jgi:hypothetical protein
MKQAAAGLYLALLAWSSIVLAWAELRPEWSSMVALPMWCLIGSTPFVLVGGLLGFVEPREALAWVSGIVALSLGGAVLAVVLMGLEVERRPDPVSLILASVHFCAAAAGAMALVRSRQQSSLGARHGR